MIRLHELILYDRCTLAFIYAYFLIPETKGLSLEQVDRMLDETTPRTSAKWRAHSTYVAEMGGVDQSGHLKSEILDGDATHNEKKSTSSV